MVGDLSELYAKVANVRDESSSTSAIEVSKYDIFVFISLDITNSTRLKQEQPKLWPQIISEYYTVIFDKYGVGSYQPKLSAITCPVEFWKYVGDEVLLYSKVFNREDIYNLVEATALATKTIPGCIADKFRNNISIVQEINEDGEKIGQILGNAFGIKATMWIAPCGENPNENRNIIYRSENSELLTHQSCDFLGPEIDGGFRIAKYAVKNRVIVSPFLAASIFSDSTNQGTDTPSMFKNHFKTISFQPLKGIWDDRPVPIVMYSSQFDNFYDEAEYDEIELDVYREMRGRELCEFLKDKRCDIDYLQKIIKDVKLTSVLNIIRDRLNDENYRATENPNISFLKNELHIACACFSAEGKLLVHNHHKRGWEFGCTTIREATEWKSAIENGYKSKYDLTIHVEDTPIPVATYIYQPCEDNNYKIALGIIVIGSLVSSNNLSDDFKLVNSDEIDELQGKTVENFRVNAKRAFTYINRD